MKYIYFVQKSKLNLVRILHNMCLLPTPAVLTRNNHVYGRMVPFSLVDHPTNDLFQYRLLPKTGTFYLHNQTSKNQYVWKIIFILLYQGN